MAMRGLNQAGSGRTGQDGAATKQSLEPRPGLIANGFGLRRRPGVPGTGNTWRWFFSGVWLVYLIAPVSDLFGHRNGVLWIAGGLAIAIVFAVLYVPVVA